jgi:hypothetical protein
VVVREPVRRAGQQVRGGGGDDDQVGLLAEPHVRHLVHVGPDVGAHGLAGQGRPGGGADELEGSARGDDGDVVAGLGQPPEELDGLVGGDAAGHAEDDAAHGGA